MPDHFGIPKKIPPNTKPSSPRIDIIQVANQIKTSGFSANYNELSSNLKKTLINNLKNIQKEGTNDEKNYINSFFRNTYTVDQKKNENDRENLIKNTDFYVPIETDINNIGSSSSSRRKPANKKEVNPQYSKENLAQLQKREREKILKKMRKKNKQQTDNELTEAILAGTRNSSRSNAGSSSSSNAAKNQAPVKKNKKQQPLLSEPDTARKISRSNAATKKPPPAPVPIAITSSPVAKRTRSRTKSNASSSSSNAGSSNSKQTTKKKQKSSTASSTVAASQTQVLPPPTSQSSSQSSSQSASQTSSPAKSPPPVVSVSPQTDAKSPSQLPQSSSQSASQTSSPAKSPPPVVSVSPQTDAKSPSQLPPVSQAGASPTSQSSSQSLSQSASPTSPLSLQSPPADVKSPPPQAGATPSSPASTANTSTPKSPSQSLQSSPGPSEATSQTDAKLPSPQSPPTASPTASPSPPLPPKTAVLAPLPEAEPPIKYYKKLELPKYLDTKDYRNKIVAEMKDNNFPINYKSFKKYSTSNIDPDTVECIVFCKKKKDDGFTKCGFKNTHIKLKKKNYENNLVISNKNNKLDKLENITGTFTICTKHFKEFLGIKMKYSKSINKIIMTAAKNFNKNDFVCGNDFLDISQFLPYYEIDNSKANVIVDDTNPKKIIAKKEIKEGEELILFLPN